MSYSLYNWIGKHEITKLKKKKEKKLATNPEKKDTKKGQKDMNEME